VHFNKSKRDKERRKSMEELMDKFDEMTFNIHVMCKTLKVIFNNLASTTAAAATAPTTISERSNLETSKNECRQLLIQNLIYCLKRDTLNCKKQSQSQLNQMKAYSREKSSTYFKYDDRRYKLKI
jgi:hypothetical protein